MRHSQHASATGLHSLVSPHDHPALCAVATLAALACYAMSNAEEPLTRHEGIMSDSALEICDSLRAFGVPAGEWHKDPASTGRYICATPAHTAEWASISLSAWSSPARTDLAPNVRLTGSYQSAGESCTTVNQMTWAASAIFVRLGMAVPPVIRKTIQSPGSSDIWIRESRITSSHQCAGAACQITVLIQRSHEKYD